LGALISIIASHEVSDAQASSTVVTAGANITIIALPFFIWVRALSFYANSI